MARPIRIGCGAGFWGGSPEAPARFVRGGAIDFLVLDNLAEVAMSILARMRAKNAELGYAPDFVGLCSFSIDKPEVSVSIRWGEANVEIPARSLGESTRARPNPMREIGRPLPPIAVAHGRSVDKDDTAHIDVFAPRPEFAAAPYEGLTAKAVGAHFTHHAKRRVERFAWPGHDGFPYVLHGALGEGGGASLRHDRQGKALARALMDPPLAVPAVWLEPEGPLEGGKDTSPNAPHRSVGAQ